MLQSFKRKIRLHKIKKEAKQPRRAAATMEDVQRKLQNYQATPPLLIERADEITVQYHP